MAFKTFCDICDKESENIIRVSKRLSIEMYCKRCWNDEKNWKKIHENKSEDNSD